MFVSINDNLIDNYTSSIQDEESVSQRTSDKTVSELLSSYYNVSERSSPETTKEKNEKDPNLKKPATITDKDFQSHSFDAEYHFDNLLRHNSISDIISLLRKLERETRQLTAGKQLLIYDNYECLFSSLDTVETINKELDQVQNHLRTLKSSQIKASSKDITSKYGIRDKFLQISHLSKASEVFELLANLCNTLVSFSTSNTLLYLNKDESSKVLTYTRQEILYFCSRVYYLFKHFEGEYNFLFRNYYTLFTEVVSKNARSLVSEDHPVDPEGLLEACKSLRELNFDQSQLLGLFLFNLSSLLENKIKNVYINYTNKDFSFVSLCKEVFGSLLKVVYNSISNNSTNEFFNDSSDKKGEGFCFYCSKDAEPEFEYGYSGLFQGFRFVSNNKCECKQEDLRNQFVLFYTQASFFIFSYLLTSNKYTLNCKEVSAGLVVLFEILSTLKIETKLHTLFLDHSLKWMMAMCILYLQYLFFTFYDSVISKFMAFLNGSHNSDLNSYFLSLYEKAVKDAREVLDFARDFSKSMNNNFEQVFNSLLVVYTCGFKYVFRVIYDNLNLVKLQDKEDNYLDSVLDLTSMRTASEKNKKKLQDEYLRNKNLELNKNNNQSGGEEEGVKLSLLEFMNTKVKSQLEKFKFDQSQHKVYTKNLLTFLMKLETVFGNLMGVMERNFKESFKMYSTETMVMEVRPKIYGEFEDMKLKFKEETHKVTNKSRLITIFDDVNIDENIPFVNMIMMGQNYNKNNQRYFPLGSKRNKEEQSSDNKGEKEDKLEQQEVYKSHFERFNINVNDLANEVVSQIMLEYLTKALKMLRFVFESLESKRDVVEEGIKDFTILLSEVLQDLNLLTVTQSNPETESQNKQLDKALNTSLNESDVSALVNLYKFKFNTSRDMCLKLFTLHIVQALSQYKRTYMVEESDLSRLFEGLKQQILIIFKKNLDLFIMQSVWEKVLNLS